MDTKKLTFKTVFNKNIIKNEEKTLIPILILFSSNCLNIILQIF